MIYETNAYCGSVKTGKSRSEQLFSDLPPEADLTADIVDVAKAMALPRGGGHAAIGPGQRELSLKRLFGHEHDA